MSDIERDPGFELTDELASFVEALHGSEINGEIGWFYDNVWRAKLGDPLNGYVAERDGFLSRGARGAGGFRRTGRVLILGHPQFQLRTLA